MVVMTTVLLDTAIDLNHINNLGWTCLIEIAYLSDGGVRVQDIARHVLQAGADPNIADKKGMTALAHAQVRKLTALAAILRAYGAK